MQDDSKRIHVATNDGAAPRYLSIGQYGVIGDCRTALLVGPYGNIDWACLPHFDSPAIFCRLLDADKGGYFQVCPGEAFEASLAYLDNTNVLETMFRAERGRMRLVDFMPVRQRPRPSVLGQIAERLPLPNNNHHLEAGYEYQIGNDVAAAHRVTRIATCLEGSTTLNITLKATFDYARKKPEIEPASLTTGGAGAVLSAGGRYLVFFVRFLPTHIDTAAAAPITLSGDDETLRVAVQLTAGQRAAVIVNYARSAAEAQSILQELTQHDFDEDLAETLSYWRQWIADCHYAGMYQEAVLRSALTLKLCTFEPTGAIVAAPTTSLPEAVGGVRNWDYRYTWLRDSAFTLGALGNLGFHSEARDYFHFLHDLHVRNVEDFRIMYGIRGESGAVLAEQTLSHLEGYKGSHPVRIGNGAATQRQMDVYGEVLDAAYHYVTFSGYRTGWRLSESNRDVRDLCQRIADYVTTHWTEKDSGIWEVRGGPRAYVYSRAMCWVALDRVCTLAAMHSHAHHLPRWSRAREAIMADVLRNGYNEDLKTFTQAYGDTNIDSANLRLPLTSFLPVTDERMRSTIAVTEQQLAGENGILFRYQPYGVKSGSKAEQITSVDNLPGEEGAFLACTFWLINDYCYQGRLEEARERFEKLLSYASPLGLYSEELDQQTGELIGNFPQAFTHIGLINSAIFLQRAQEGKLAVDLTNRATRVQG